MGFLDMLLIITLHIGDEISALSFPKPKSPNLFEEEDTICQGQSKGSKDFVVSIL